MLGNLLKKDIPMEHKEIVQLKQMMHTSRNIQRMSNDLQQLQYLYVSIMHAIFNYIYQIQIICANN
jgi:hypothetical protein